MFCVLKSIEIEAVFTKIEINNEWNVNSLQNTRCVEKVSRQKLYLPKLKWTMNKTLILTKICAVLKKSIETEAVFTKIEMNNEWNVNSFQNTRCVEKVSRQKLYLPKSKWTTNETLILSKIRAVLRKYRDRSCIFENWNEQWTKC